VSNGQMKMGDYRGQPISTQMLLAHINNLGGLGSLESHPNMQTAPAPVRRRTCMEDVAARQREYLENSGAIGACPH
jgi:hypothetical protein